MTGSIVAALAVGAFGVLLVWWAGACRRGTFRRNPVLGYRTPLTLRDDGAWLAAHRAAARYLTWAGVGTVVGGVAGAVAIWAGLRVAAVVLVGGAILWALALTIGAGFPAVRAARRAIATG